MAEGTLPDRIKAKIDDSSGCWQWLGYVDPRGYGTVRWDGKSRWVHRVAWEILRGPIPADREIDHLCRNRSCINPDHLELVTHAENMRRGTAAEMAGKYQQAKTCCPQGHPYDEANTYRFGPDKRYRACRQCRNEMAAAYKKRVGYIAPQRRAEPSR